MLALLFAGLLAGEPRDTDKVVNLFNDGSIPVTLTIEGLDPVKLGPHEKATRTLPSFGTYVVTLDTGGGNPKGRRFDLGDEDGFYIPPRTIHWCVVAKNHALNLMQRQECAGRIER